MGASGSGSVRLRFGKLQRVAEMDEVNTRRRTLFVDYTPPAAANILPPAKYKLSLIIYCLVYLAVWFADKAGLTTFLRFNGWLSFECAFFLQLAMSVFTLTFGALDVFREAFTCKVHGKLYGVGAWLKQPRSTWLYRYSHVFAEFLAGIIHILEDGFAMFNALPEKRRIDPMLFHVSPGTEDANNKQLVELRVEHHINVEKLQEYERWQKKIKRVSMRHAHGLVEVIPNEQNLPSVSSSDTSFEGNGININSVEDADNGNANINTSKDAESDGVLFSTSLMFEDIDSLNEWMVSPRRKVYMSELKDFLLVPNVERLGMNRDLPDAYTDLVSQQGASVPSKANLPKKWKVWWLTLISLFISSNWTDHFMAYYYEFWGLNNAHTQLLRLVSIGVTVFTNSYIIVPLLLFLFAPWLKRKKHEKIEMKQPWRALNEGLPSLRWKCALTFAFYGGCFITWMVKDPSFP